VRTAAHAQTSPVLVDNGGTEPKSDTRPLQILGGEKGIEDARTVLRCDSGSVVRNRDPDGPLGKIAP